MKIRIHRLNLDSALVAIYAAAVLFFSYTEGRTIITKFVGVLICIRFLILIMKGEPVRYIREFGLLAIWFLLSLVGTAMAVDPQVALDRTLTILQVYGVSFALAQLLVRSNRTDVMFVSVLVSTLIIAIMAYQNPEAYTIKGRVAGTFGNANIFGLVCFVSIVANLYFVFTTSNVIKKLLLIVPIPFLYDTMLDTGSRKAMIVVSLVLLLAAIREVISRLRVNPSQGIAAIFAATILIGFGVQNLTESKHYSRLDKVISAAEDGSIRSADGSVEHRIILIESAIEEAFSHPFFGIGLDNWKLEKTGGVFGQAFGSYTHSNVVEILVSTGFVGFLLYYFIFVSVAARLLRATLVLKSTSDRVLCFITGVLFLGYLMYDFAMVSYYEKVSWLILTTIISSAFILDSQAAMRANENKKAGRANYMD